MKKKLSVIIPVSQRENPYLIEKSIAAFSAVDFTGFDETIVYAIDDGRDRDDYRHMEVPDNTVLLFVHNNTLKQAGGYNAGLDYGDCDYISFLDLDAIPRQDFFQRCLEVDVDFVACDRCISNPNINGVTKTISEEYEFCNTSRRFLAKYIGKYHPASCTGLIHEKVFEKFRFTESTGADLELYKHILKNRFTMGYADTSYWELSPTTTNELDKQRLRWFQDTYRTCLDLLCAGTWKENIATLIMVIVVALPILTIPLAILYITHYWGYNLILHTFEMQKISLRALWRAMLGKDVSWNATKK